MAVSNYRFQAALCALRMAETSTDVRDLHAWAVIADYLEVSHNHGYLRAIAGGIAEHRGDVGESITTQGGVIEYGIHWPGEHAQMTGWTTKGRSPSTGQPLAHWNRSRDHVLALVLAYLMGMPVSCDVWHTCREFEIDSVHAQDSLSVPGPYPLDERTGIITLKRPGA